MDHPITSPSKEQRIFQYPETKRSSFDSLINYHSRQTFTHMPFIQHYLIPGIKAPQVIIHSRICLSRNFLLCTFTPLTVLSRNVENVPKENLYRLLNVWAHRCKSVDVYVARTDWLSLRAFGTTGGTFVQGWAYIKPG